MINDMRVLFFNFNQTNRIDRRETFSLSLVRARLIFDFVIIAC